MIHGCPSIDHWYGNVPRSARLPTALGALVLVLWVFGFGAWAAMAPLASAVVASGSFVATGQNKQVQHLEGGIIREMLVREGELVQANQPLLRLDDTAVKSKLRRLILKQYRLIAVSARLEAEMQSSDKLQLPAALAKGSNGAIRHPGARDRAGRATKQPIGSRRGSEEGNRWTSGEYPGP
jgi:membrane fusion protein, type I secretion system